jgi:hypothetical protein
MLVPTPMMMNLDAMCGQQKKTTPIPPLRLRIHRICLLCRGCVGARARPPQRGGALECG